MVRLMIKKLWTVKVLIFLIHLLLGTLINFRRHNAPSLLDTVQWTGARILFVFKFTKVERFVSSLVLHVVNKYLFKCCRNHLINGITAWETRKKVDVYMRGVYRRSTKQGVGE